MKKTSDILFNYTVEDILNGEKTAMLPKSVFKAVNGKKITYVYDTYPFNINGEYPAMEVDAVCNANTYGELVKPICEELNTIKESGEFDFANHGLDEVFIETILIEDDVISIQLGS